MGCNWYGKYCIVGGIYSSWLFKLYTIDVLGIEPLINADIGVPIKRGCGDCKISMRFEGSNGITG